MTRFVVDAPTLLELVRSGDRVSAEHQLVAPNSVRSEALELMLHQVRAGSLEDRDALRLHTRLTEVKMRLLGDRVSRATAWQIAREQGWDSLRDAEYLAVARLQADALVTVDPDLRSKAEGLVPLASYDDLLRATAG